MLSISVLVLEVKLNLSNMSQPTVKSLKKENDQLKNKMESLIKDFRRLEAGLEEQESAMLKSKDRSTSPDTDTIKSLEFMSEEYDELNNFRATAKRELLSLNTRLSELKSSVDTISNAIDDLQQYSYSYNVKLFGIPETTQRESANESTTVCANLFKEMGADVNIEDIDIAHRIPSRTKSDSPRPIVCKFIRRIAREKVMAKRKEISKVSKLKIGLSDSSFLTEARIVDHLTPKNQQLLMEAKEFKSKHEYSYCWTRNGVVYLRKSENSRPIKVKDKNVLQVLYQSENH